MTGLFQVSTERRTDNGLESPLELRQRAGLSKLHVCLPFSFSPSGFSYTSALALPGCLHIIKVPLSHICSVLYRTELHWSEVEEKTVSVQA